MTAEIRRTLAALAPDGVVEVRALADYATHSGYFDDPEALARQVEALCVDTSVAGIYITLNEVNPALLSRRANRIKMRLSKKDATTSDADIIRRRWLPVDIDPVRPSGVSSTEEEHEAALAAADRIAAYLAEQGFPDPVRADSGNGAHLLYQIDLLSNDEATGLVKGCLATLDALFSNSVVTVDTSNYNAARIWKLYGTMSRKGDNTPERPHRRARLLSVPEEIAIVPLERLQHLAGLLPREEPPAPKKNGNGIDLRTWLTGHGISIQGERPWQGGTLFTFDECPFSSAHRDGAFAIQFGNGAVFAGCHHASCGGGVQRWPELRDRFEPREKRVQKAKEIPPPSPPSPAEDEYRARALEILQHGDPLAFLLETFNKEHVGDRIVAECLIMSVASQSVKNTRGLHVSISGNSGKGKSHACTTMINLIPQEYRLTGTVSNKALFYHEDLRPGTVILFDDTSLSDDLQEVLKSATSSFDEPIEHRTLTMDRQLRVCSIPERCVWWLAKVENAGDDQVMNRMLTVWIDDSAEQDRAVLEHLKRAAVGAVTGNKTDPDVLTAWAIWAVLKEQRVFVRIPFACRIQFSNVSNRRNPAMLFDLIKCHAVLRSMQRERDGNGALLAVREDFDAAARLYAAINHDFGGQDSKMTRNEAAALATITRMGWQTFTARQLQQAMGLSYYQIRRIMHGYAARGMTYCGLLEKCPALSVVDATVIETIDGVTVRQHENQYFFDAGRYREWMAELAVWLEEGEDDPSPDPGDEECKPPCQGVCKGVCQGVCQHPGDQRSLHSIEKTANVTVSRGIFPAKIRVLATISETQCMADRDTPDHGVATSEDGNDPGSLYAFSKSANTFQENSDTTRNPENTAVLSKENSGSIGTPLGTPIGTPPGNMAYNKGDRRSGKVLVQPLPGVLDHRTFERVSVDLGRCTICNTGKAVYRSRSDRTSICEGCYARLVREWNAQEGVR